MEETRISGDLPGLRMEVTHRAEPDGSAEHMVINLTATPDFRAALPLAGRMTPMMLPQMMMESWQAMMAPWQAVARANPLLAALLPPTDDAKK